MAGTYAPLLEHAHDAQGIGMPSTDPLTDSHEALTFHHLPKEGAIDPNVGNEAQIAPDGAKYASRAMLLPSDPAARKDLPITTGVLDYFPLAIAEVARVSKAGNDQHNPGQPLHWAKGKSMDHADCIPRHLIDRGSLDTDGMRHSAKLAWRALALLQTELENDANR